MPASPANHLSPQVLRALAAGRLHAGAADVVAHLDSCAACRQAGVALLGDGFLLRLHAAHPPAGTEADPLALADTAGVDPSPGQAPITSGAAPAVLPELRDHPQYEVLRALGSGGMGVVYLAKNKLMNRPEVLKVVNRRLLGQAGAAERFLREIRSAAKLSHPNIVTAYSALQAGELLVFAMEYVDGEDLAQFVQTRGPLPVVNACYYAQQVALGLKEAHKKGLVHRDIKPKNLILARDGKEHVVKILDFGLAKATRENEGTHQDLTASGMLLGTPHYMAPEQTQNAAAADIRADIYSLGCTLYFLLVGRPPFEANSLYDLLNAHHTREATPLTEIRRDLPAELAAVVARMMAKEPRKRYQKPAEVAQALVPFLKVGVKPLPAARLPPECSKTSALGASNKPHKAVVNTGNTQDAPATTPLMQGAVIEGKTTIAPAMKRAGPDQAPAPSPPAARRVKNLVRFGLVGLGLATLLLAGLSIFRANTPEGILELVEPTSVFLETGEEKSVEIKVRRTNLDGPVHVTFSNLSPGIMIKPLTIPGGINSAQTKIHAEWDASLGSQQVQIAGECGEKRAESVLHLETRLPPAITNSIGMKLVLIPAGKFKMGSPETEEGREPFGKGSEKLHDVKMTRPFYMGVFTVTQAEYEKVMAKNPSYFCRTGRGKDKVEDFDTSRFPVEQVSYKDAEAFCKKLSELDKKQGYDREYKLPTEAQWEYACREAGKATTVFHYGNKLGSDQANFDGHYPYGGAKEGRYLERTVAVDSIRYEPNELGLYHMHGNVCQWCLDWYHTDYYSNSRLRDPQGPENGTFRVVRGGSWGNFGTNCRAAHRNGYEPGVRSNLLGFRVVLVSASRIR